VRTQQQEALVRTQQQEALVRTQQQEALVRTQQQEALARTQQQEALARTQQELARTQEQLAHTQEQLARTQQELAHTQEQQLRSGQVGSSHCIASITACALRVLWVALLQNRGPHNQILCCTTNLECCNGAGGQLFACNGAAADAEQQQGRFRFGEAWCRFGKRRRTRGFAEAWCRSWLVVHK
jgi:hypothetical protein